MKELTELARLVGADAARKAQGVDFSALVADSYGSPDPAAGLLNALGAQGFTTPAWDAFADLVCLAAGGSTMESDLDMRQAAWDLADSCGWIGVQGTVRP